MLKVYSRLVVSENVPRLERKRIRKRFKDQKQRDRKRGLYKKAKCECCGAKAQEVHHIIPISKGGTNKYDNLVSVCVSCHAKIHGR